MTTATETLRRQPSRRLQGGGGGNKNSGGGNKSNGGDNKNSGGGNKSNGDGNKNNNGGGGDKRPSDGGGEGASGEEGNLLDTVEDVMGGEPEEIKKRVKKVMFGTKNGYDTGGTDPLCYASPFSKTNTTSMMSTIHNEIEMLNEQLFEMADSTDLLPQCPRGTSMTVTPRNLDPKTMEMLLGKPYDFLLDLTFDTSNLPSHIDLDPTLPNMTVYYRLHVCDAVRQGFCNVVRDTRDKDANLTRAEADLGDDATEFPDDDSKWAYTEGTALQGLLESKNDTSTMYGRWCKWLLRRQPGTGVFMSKLNVKLQLPDDNEDEMMQFGARPYFFIAQAVVHFDMKNGEKGLRFDISQAIPSKVVYVKPQPTIMTVTRSAKVALGIEIGLFSLFALICFGVIVKNREHSVMRLAQGNFLATMAAACLMVTVFSFTYLPTRDVNCRLSGPLVYIPLTLVGAILVGRVWRIYSTLSNVNKLGSHQANGKSWAEVGLVRCLDFLAGVLVCFGRFSEKYRHTKNSFRRVVTPEETSGLIALLTIPQVVLQILGSTAFGMGLETQLSDLGNSGRIVCADDNSWIFMAGTGYASFVFILAVLMAWFSRELPSAFNEKDQIFNAATIATVITAMSIGLAQVIDQPTTSPDALVRHARSTHFPINFHLEDTGSLTRSSLSFVFRLCCSLVLLLVSQPVCSFSSSGQR